MEGLPTPCGNEALYELARLYERSRTGSLHDMLGMGAMEGTARWMGSMNGMGSMDGTVSA